MPRQNLAKTSHSPIESGEPTDFRQSDNTRYAWLWTRMAEIYGHLWTTPFGFVPSQTWMAALARFSNDHIRHAIQLCLTRKTSAGCVEHYPPNLPEFLNFCRDYTEVLKRKEYDIMRLAKPKGRTPEQDQAFRAFQEAFRKMKEEKL